MLSIIITSLTANNQTSKSLQQLDFEHEIILATEKGLGLARNKGAERAKGDLLVFLDSDLKVYPALWSVVHSLPIGSFAMAYEGFSHGGTPQPVTRVLAIHKQDFQKIRFDESIQYCGEDRDFFLTCYEKGLTPKYVRPAGYYEHIDHPLRIENRLVLFKESYELAYVLRKHGATTRVYKSFRRWLFPFMFKKSYVKLSIKSFAVKFSISMVRDFCILIHLFTRVDKN
ncbi:MAG: glycosyltransferase family A protein [Candidatus Bathyarchaeota archaeon]|nr:glycosyltransferase family A protein [Candidatus Bathyarchaeum tardum]